MSKVSESIFQSRNVPKVSGMIEAMKGWESDLVASSKSPSGQFGRSYKVETNGLTISDDFDMSFEVPFDDDAEPNEASITIYNLSQSTISKLKPDKEISITAGYGSDTGVIFSGVISTVKTKWEDIDKVTTITAIDSEDLSERDLESISFNAGVKASYVLKTLVGKLGLPIAVFKTEKDHTYTSAVTVSGNLKEAINQYSEVCGVKVYINKRKVYVRHFSDGDQLGFQVNVNTGLVGSPEEFTEEVDNEDYTETIKGVTFTMLLEHRITTASIIHLQSRDYSGTFRVREGKHTCSDSDYYTEITAIADNLKSGTNTSSVSASKSSNNWRVDRLENKI